MNPGQGVHSRAIVLRMFLLTMGMVFMALIIFTGYAYHAFENRLAPEIYKKLTVVGRSLEAQLNQALAYGIPIDSLQGMPEFLGQVIQNNPEIQYIVVSDKADRHLFSRGSAAQDAVEMLSSARTPKTNGALGSDGSADAQFDNVDTWRVPGFYNQRILLTYETVPVGSLNLGVSNQYVEQISDVAWDIVTVLFVSLLLAYQFIIILVNQRISFPMRQLEYLRERIMGGDFRKTIEFSPVDEVSRLIRAVHRLILMVNKQFELLSRAIQIAGPVVLDAASAQVRQGYDRINKKFRLTPPDRMTKLWTASLDNARVPLFFGVFAEELTRSFLPLYIDELYVPMAGLTREMVIGLPISVFMIVIALFTPWAGTRVERFSPKKVFLLGMIPAGIGFLGLSLASSVYDLLLWRSLCAVGYAMQTMACQGYIAHNTSPENRSHGMAVFVSTIMIAAICGSSIGGVLADRVGYRITFGLSVFMILFSGVAAYKSLHETGRRLTSRVSSSPRLTWKILKSLAGNVRFSLLILFSAIPAKIMLTGFLFYLMPLFLIQLGNQQADVGRMMMIYFIIMVGGVPLSSWMADRSGRPWLFVILGGIIAGLGMLIVIWRQDTLAMILGISFFGLGQSVSTSTLIAMVLAVTRKESEAMGKTSILGLFRVLERIGSVAGPFFAAFLILPFGFAGAMVGIGIMMLSSTLLLSMGLLVTARKASASGNKP
jgi:MFS family permease/HAMP domain-containing protein